MNRTISELDTSCAAMWDMPDVMIDAIEVPRLPYTEPLSKIVGQTVTEHLVEGDSILEIGAGSGYFRDLMPALYRDNLISSDYNPRNLQAGMQRRQLTAIAASAYELPIRSNSLDAVVDLDAFDTFPSFDKAFSEVERVLKPGGKFMHFQINNPSDDMLDFDYPDKVWLPQSVSGRDAVKRAAAVDRNHLIDALDAASMPESWKNVMQSIIGDPLYRHTIEEDEQASELIQIVDEITAELGLSQILVPSVFDYFRNKLEKSAQHASLSVIESGYKKESAPDTSFVAPGDLVLGRVVPRRSMNLITSARPARTASMMVLVAQKN